MSGIFSTIDTATRALGVVQRGIGVTGHNIANVETPGYSRQRQVLSAEIPSATAIGVRGLGVRQLTIERVTDAFIQNQLMRQSSSLGASEAQASGLAALEQILNEQQGEGISAALNDFYDALSDLSTSPTPGAPSERQAVLSAAQRVIDNLSSADTRVRSLMRSTDSSIEVSVENVNRITAEIHELNHAIMEQEVVAPANDLRDRRELLLQELAREVDIQTNENDSGVIGVSLAGGPSLVTEGSVRQLNAVPDPTNPFDPTLVRIEHVSGAVVTDVTADIGGGNIGGLLRLRDNSLASAVRALDTLAYNLGESVNAVHQTGLGLDGLAGDFFAPLANVEDAARNLALDARVAGNPDGIAAGLTSASLDNEVALQLAALRDTPAAIFLPGDPPGPATGPTRSLLDHAAAIVADVGQQTRTLQSAAAQQTLLMDNLENRRAEVSGVSLDEETTNLIRLQAAFQANARVVSVAQQLLDDLVSII